MSKPSWKSPHLTVVAKGKPEEKVLLGCKTGNSAGPYQKHGCGTTSCQANPIS